MSISLTVHLDNDAFDVKPTDQAVIGSLKKRLHKNSQSMSLEQLAHEHCINGKAYSPSIGDGTADGTTQQQVYVLDFDNKAINNKDPLPYDEQIKPADVEKRLAHVNLKPAFIGYSPSHIPNEWERFRVYIVLDYPLSDKAQKIKGREALGILLPEADPQAGKLGQFFFGSTKGLYNSVQNVTNAPQILFDIADEHEVREKEYRQATTLNNSPKKGTLEPIADLAQKIPMQEAIQAHYSNCSFRQRGRMVNVINHDYGNTSSFFIYEDSNSFCDYARTGNNGKTLGGGVMTVLIEVVKLAPKDAALWVENHLGLAESRRKSFIEDQKREQYNANRVYDEQLGAYVNTAVEVPPQPKTWEAITLFDGLDLPSLDPAFLPDEYREYCACISQELQVPIELVIAIFFSMVGTAVQGKFAVLVKKNYIEELCLFWMPLLNPSERKSATLSRLKSPVQQWERTKAEAMKDEIVRRNSERQTLQMAIDDRRKKAARAKNTEERQKYMAEIAQFEEDMPEALYAPLLFLDDATAESIVYALSIHGSVTFAEAEGKLMDILAGLYGKSHNFDVFLKGYGAETIRTHRRNAAPIFVPSPRITMCLAVQLFIIQNRAAGQAFRNKGLDSRLNFFAPKSKVGFRDLEPQATPDHVEEKYRALLHRLLDIDMPENPHLLTLSPEAYNVYMTFAKRVEESLSPQGEYADMPDWQGKAVGKAIRIAGLIHCMEHIEPQKIPIQVETMNNACYLVEILGAHARVVYGLMDEPEQISIAKKALKWITDNKCKTFTKRDCNQAIKGTFPTVEQAQKELDELEERNFIRLVPQTQPRGKGKPASPTYEVNPTLYEVKS